MSRIRTVKPDFWVSEQVISCSPFARLLFIGLWNFCDDHGVHPASYVRLKAEIFPMDSFSIEEVKQWVDELIANDLLREYAVNNKRYWIVTGWHNHQRIDKPTYRHPLPLSELKEIKDNSSNIQRELVDYSSTTPRIVSDCSVTEWKGMEGNGKEKEICEVKTSQLASTNAEEIFQHWQKIMNHPRAKLDKKRETKIAQALKLGYSIDDLKQAINGCANTPFNMGQNDRLQRYDDLELILRDASHIDRFIGNEINTPAASTNQKDIAANSMAGVGYE